MLFPTRSFERPVLEHEIHEVIVMTLQVTMMTVKRSRGLGENSEKRM